jgi:hypothetical protein
MKCECEITYSEFRTGYTFKEIRHILKREAKRKYEKGEYMFITRHTVLGRWRELKLEMWNHFQSEIDKYGCSCSNKN